MKTDNLNARQLALNSLEVIGSPPESQFDDLTLLATEICQVPVGLIALADGQRLWFKSKLGFDLPEIPLETSICRRTLEGREVFVIEDVSKNVEFKENPFVTGERHVRFYAGTPLRNADNVVLGTLCVMDQKPGRLTAFQREALQILARQVVVALEQRAHAARFTRLAAEREQEQKDQAFRMIFDNLPVGLVRIFSKTGRIEIANTAYAKLTGYSESELRLLTVHDLSHPDDRAQSVSNLETHAADRAGFSLDKRYLRKNGEVIWVRIKASPIEAGGETYSCAVFDVSEEFKARAAEKEAFRRVAASEEQLDVATTSAQVGVWEWDLGDNSLRLSEIERRLLGIAGEGPVFSYAQFRDCIHPDDRVALEEVLERVVRGEIEYNHEFRVVIDGQIRYLSGRGKVIHDDGGKPIKMVGANNDITDIRREALEKEQLRLAELAARSASQIKTEFLANMSHEIRTPLNGVIGLTDLLLDTPLAEDQLHFARAVKQSSNVLLELINDILDFTKIEAGKLDLDAKVFDLADLARDVEQCFRPLATDKGILLDLHLNLGVSTRYVGDAGRLRQVLNNLVGNALKFTREGRIDIYVSESASESRRRLTFRVRDTGVGITAKAMPKLFKSFSQGDASTAREFGGSGLGLAICKRLIHMMDGDITVESREGVGSEFTFHVQLAPLMATPPPPVKRTAPVTTVDPALVARRARFRVLIAEDNTVNQEVALRFLLKAGFQVDVVSNGEEAVRAAAIKSYDIVIMDCQMPVMDGYQAAGELRASGKTFPIVALTANAFTTDRERCLSAGMVDYLTKPIRNEVLVGAVDRWLDIAAAK